VLISTFVFCHPPRASTITWTVGTVVAGTGVNVGVGVDGAGVGDGGIGVVVCVGGTGVSVGGKGIVVDVEVVGKISVDVDGSVSVGIVLIVGCVFAISIWIVGVTTWVETASTHVVGTLAILECEAL